MEGIPGHETGDLRLPGSHAAIGQYPDIKIFVSQTANLVRDQGFNIFQNIMEFNPEVEAVFAVNDMMALGAIEAIEQSYRTGDIGVVGFDAVDDARVATGRKECQFWLLEIEQTQGEAL